MINCVVDVKDEKREEIINKNESDEKKEEVIDRNESNENESREI